MTRPDNRLDVAKGLALAIALVGSFFTIDCGSGDGTLGGGRTATFVPASPSPPPLSVTMQPGTPSGNIFQVRIVAKDIDDFFGAAFHVTFNSTSATFLSSDFSGSFLSGSGVDTEFRAVLQQAGVLDVVATRVQNAQGTVTGVDVVGEDDLVVLTFGALAATAGNAFEFGAPPSHPREVCDSDQPLCTAIPVTWSGGTLTAN